MAPTSPSKRHESTSFPSNEESSTYSPSSDEDSIDSSDIKGSTGSTRTPSPQTTVSLSPMTPTGSPLVYSKGTAQRMLNDRDVRILEKIERKEKENAANNLSSESLKRIKAYIAIQIEIRKALDGEESDLNKYPAELEAVREADNFLTKAISDDIDFYKTGPSKELWTLSAGAASYLLTFSAGTLLASDLEMPWLSPIVIAICWTLCERFPPMIRATSWSNTHADVTYPEIMRLTKRAARDWVRTSFALDPKYFYRNGKKMTASEARAGYSLLKAWLGKVLSDDIVSHTFTFFYIVRNVSLRLCASPGFLATLPGKALSLGTLCLAGLCAGGTAALGFQALRGCRYKADNPDDHERGETLVKSRKIWRAEADTEFKRIELIKKYAEDITKTESEVKTDAISFMQENKDKASAKSKFWSALLYEFSCLFLEKSHFGDEDNGEVSGKLHQTISGFFAKMLCLLPSALFVMFVVTVFASPKFSLAQQLGLLMVSPLILILGFGLRKELELVILVIIGLILGVKDVVNYKNPNKDKSQTASVMPTSKSPARQNVISRSGMETPVSPMRQRLGDKNRPDGTQEETSSSSSFSANMV